MRTAAPAAITLVIGMALGFVLGGRPCSTGTPGPTGDRPNAIEVNCPVKTVVSGRAHHQLRVYRTHGDPLEMRRDNNSNIWIVTVRAANGDQTYFAEEPIE